MLSDARRARDRAPFRSVNGMLGGPADGFARRVAAVARPVGFFGGRRWLGFDGGSRGRRFGGRLGGRRGFRRRGLGLRGRLGGGRLLRRVDRRLAGGGTMAGGGCARVAAAGAERGGDYGRRRARGFRQQPGRRGPRRVRALATATVAHLAVVRCPCALRRARRDHVAAVRCGLRRGRVAGIPAAASRICSSPSRQRSQPARWPSSQAASSDDDASSPSWRAAISGIARSQSAEGAATEASGVPRSSS